MACLENTPVLFFQELCYLLGCRSIKSLKKHQTIGCFWYILIKLIVITEQIMALFLCLVFSVIQLLFI